MTIQLVGSVFLTTSRSGCVLSLPIGTEVAPRLGAGTWTDEGKHMDAHAGRELLFKIYQDRRKSPDEHQGGFQLHYFLLYEVVLGLQVKEALELGAGRSTLVILDALQSTGGHLTTCALKFNAARFGGLDANPRWTRFDGPSDHYLKTIPDATAYDFVLHDGSHERAVVHRDLQRIVPHMKRFGMILVHDTQHHKLGRGMADAVQSALDGVAHSHTTLPYGFGLTLIRIEEDLGRGSVSPSRVKRGTGSHTKPFSLGGTTGGMGGRTFSVRNPAAQTFGEWLRHTPGKILRPEFWFRK